MKSKFDQAFNELLASWRHHEMLRASHAPISDLVESRMQLQRARVEVSQARRTF